MPVLLPNDIEPLTPADAAEVEQNYNVLEQYINANVITRDGSVAMQAPLQLFSSPTQEQHAATKAYVDALLPIGVILPFGGIASPVGSWRLCNGADMSVAAYPKLHAVIGFNFGGSGGTFKLPNCNGRVPIGMQPGVARFDKPGDVGGTWQVPVQQHAHVMTHNHPSFNSGNEPQNHYHNEDVHTHPIPHDHPQFNTGSAGGHAHSGDVAATNSAVAAGGYNLLRPPGGGPNNLSTAVDAVAAHAHTANVPAFSGNSGNNAAAHTGNQSARHNHPIDVPNFVGNTANAGVDNAEHLPPYIVINYIIRID